MLSLPPSIERLHHSRLALLRSMQHSHAGQRNVTGAEASTQHKKL